MTEQQPQTNPMVESLAAPEGTTYALIWKQGDHTYLDSDVLRADDRLHVLFTNGSYLVGDFRSGTRFGDDLKMRGLPDIETKYVKHIWREDRPCEHQRLSALSDGTYVCDSDRCRQTLEVAR